MSQNKYTKEREEFEQRFRNIKGHMCGDGYVETGDISGHIWQFIQNLLEKREEEIIMLRSDIAWAIGRAQGLGHPDPYLEKRYPDLYHPKEK